MNGKWKTTQKKWQKKRNENGKTVKTFHNSTKCKTKDKK